MNKFLLLIIFLGFLAILFAGAFFVFKDFTVEDVAVKDSFYIPADIPNISEYVTSSMPEDIAQSQTQEGGGYYLNDLTDVEKQFLAKASNFVEVNIPDMKVRAFKEGQLEKEVDIAAKGNYLDWGAVPAGLNVINQKIRAAFSVPSGLYMPWALQIYGKFYLHGIPYYPSGKKFWSRFSGGCIRMKDEDAPKIFNIAQQGWYVFVVDAKKDLTQYPTTVFAQFPKVSANSYLVADVNADYVFAQKASQQQFKMGSLTKLMSAMTVTENVDLNRKIYVQKAMIDLPGDTPGLAKDKNYRLYELVYPMLISDSHNAAKVLGNIMGQEKTIDTMNAKAKSIMMASTEFFDTHGYSSENKTTAQDLYYLTRYIFNNSDHFLKITKSKRAENLGALSFNLKELNNSNIFTQEPYFWGGMAGSNNGAFLFKFQNIEKPEEKKNISIILLDSQDIKKDVEIINDWMKEHYLLQLAQATSTQSK